MPKHVADPTSFDWNTIPMSKGNAVKSFTIKNTGTDILKLYNVKPHVIAQRHMSRLMEPIVRVLHGRFILVDRRSAERRGKIDCCFRPGISRTSR